MTITATTATASIPALGRSKMNAVVFASCLGTVIEWYDFLIYATAAALVFNQAFFPTFDPLAGTLAALGTYAVGFLGRPLGGALFGHFGDRLGRKSMLVLTLFVMGLSTFAIGLLPTYQSIERRGADPADPAARHSRHRAWRSMGRSLADGARARAGRQAWLLRKLRTDRISGRPGARLARLRVRHQAAERGLPRLGLAHSVPGEHPAAGARHLCVRWRVPETPVFEKLKATGGLSANPVGEAVSKNGKAFLIAVGLKLSEVSWVYMLTVFVVVYATTKLSLPKQLMLDAVLYAAALELISLPLFGWLSDKIGRRPLYIFGALFDRVRVPAVLDAVREQERRTRHHGGDDRDELRPRHDVRTGVHLLS